MIVPRLPVGSWRVGMVLQITVDLYCRSLPAGNVPLEWTSLVTSTRTIKIVVALIDPRPLTRESLARALEAQQRGLRVIALGAAAEIEALPADIVPTLVLLNVAGIAAPASRMTGEIEAARAVIGNLPLIVLSDSEAVDDILAALRHGVRGYVPMSLELRVVTMALQLVAAGGTFVPAEPLLAQLSKLPPPPTMRSMDSLNGPSPLLAGFSPRHLAVLELLRQGKSNRLIAQELELSEATVKVLVRQIMKRLGVTNRTQVALLVTR